MIQDDNDGVSSVLPGGLSRKQLLCDSYLRLLCDSCWRCWRFSSEGEKDLQREDKTRICKENRKRMEKACQETKEEEDEKGMQGTTRVREGNEKDHQREREEKARRGEVMEEREKDEANEKKKNVRVQGREHRQKREERKGEEEKVEEKKRIENQKNVGRENEKTKAMRG